MKTLLITVLSIIVLSSCKKETPQPIQTKYLRASIKFTAPYVGEYFNNGVDSLSIQVEGQPRFSFKTYLHVCNSRSFAYTLKSPLDTELIKYTISADNKIIESGFISFDLRNDKVIK